MPNEFTQQSWLKLTYSLLFLILTVFLCILCFNLFMANKSFPIGKRSDWEFGYGLFSNFCKGIIEL